MLHNANGNGVVSDVEWFMVQCGMVYGAIGMVHSAMWNGVVFDVECGMV